MAAPGSGPPLGHVNGAGSAPAMSPAADGRETVTARGSDGHLKTAGQQMPAASTSLKRKREDGDVVKREGSIASDIPVLGAVHRGDDCSSSSSSTSNGKEREQSLRPTQDECLKLASVVKMLDKHGLARESLPAEAGVPSFLEALAPSEDTTTTTTTTTTSKTERDGDTDEDAWPYSFGTLEFYLDLAVSSVQSRLLARDSTAKATNSRQKTSNTTAKAAAASSSEEARAKLVWSLSEIDQFVHTVRNLFRELKDAAATRQGFQRVKAEPAPKFALHRTLGTTDIFTSAAELSTDEKYLSELRDTDVLAVHPTPISRSIQPTKLGEVSSKPKVLSRTADLTPKVSPVTFLYYDPYASFAPTYDSSTATLSYSQSVHYRNSRQSVSAWHKKPLPPLPPFVPAGAPKPPLDEAIDPALLEAVSSDEPTSEQAASDVPTVSSSLAVVKQAIREVEDTEVVERRLAENAELLRVLQEAQWERLRKSTTPGWGGDAWSSRNNSLPKLSKMEQESAARIGETLKTLLNARPRLSDTEDAYNPLLPMTHEQYTFIKTLLVQPDAAPFYGVLDKSNAKGIREDMFPKPPQAPQGGGRGGGRGSKKAKHAHGAQQQQQSANSTSAQETKRETQAADVAVPSGGDVPVPGDSSMQVDS